MRYTHRQTDRHANIAKTAFLFRTVKIRPVIKYMKQMTDTKFTGLQNQQMFYYLQACLHY